MLHGMVGRRRAGRRPSATGLDARLVRDTLGLTGRRHVELTAVMAQYNPFAERAGMRKILVKEPTEKVVEAVERLKALGFTWR